MDRLLNRGFNFSILPTKIDTTQLLVDIKRYERSAIWTEFHYGRENENVEAKPIFKTEKNNLPQNYTIPHDLKIFLNSVGSEISDPRNRNKEECNLPPDELAALKELITLQKNKAIVIKACDKGAGIIILNYNDYMKACYLHLTSNQTANKPYYSQVDEFEIDRVKLKIDTILKEALTNEIISRDEYNAMNADNKEPARFYCNFKVHKKHDPNTVPPERPIISGSGSITEGIGTYINHHIKDIGTHHDTYLQDTPHFLRIIEQINSGPNLETNVFLATLDVTGLYTNIAHEEGLECVEEQLNQRNNQAVPTDFLVKLMEVILYNNVFEFHETFWKQNIGAAMGSKPIPPYANIFMAKIDKLIRISDVNKALQLLKRFLDDFFLIYKGTTKSIHALLVKINNINPSIKLTMSHTSRKNEPIEDKCDCPETESIPFLDTRCSIKEGKIDIDLHKKDTDRNQYLLPSSCHPAQTKKAIPYSLSLRIIRACTNPMNRDLRLQELKINLMERDYSEQLIDRAIKRAKKVPRHIALRKVLKTQKEKGPILVHTYDPRLPSLSSIQAKHWRTMSTNDSYMAEVFKKPPLTAYRRQPNLRNWLIRAKVPNGNHQKRKLKGMTKCGKSCTACPFIREGKSLQINKKQWSIEKKYDCNTFNVVYAIMCKKERCKEAYIGETKRLLRSRIADHCGYVQNQKVDTATGTHFNLPGHSLADMTVTVLEQSKRNNEQYRKQRESYHINRFNTFHKGINRQK